MGNYYSDIEEDDKKDEKKENEVKDNSKSLMDSFNISSKYPTKENQPMILADNIYLQKNSELGKKHSRPKDSNEEDNFYENKKKLKIKKDNEEELKIEKVDEVDEDKNNKLNEDNNIKNTIELKKEQNIEIQIIKQKKEKKLKME